MKAIYIGAGTDTSPIENFKDIKLFYYIDGQPNSEFGVMQSGIIRSDGSDGFSRPNFIPKLDNNMKEVGLKLVNIYDNLRIYSNNDQMVYYYTNTSIPEHYEYLKDKINDFDTLIVMGHDPDSIFLNATSKDIHFIGNHITCYSHDEFESENSIVYKMHNSDIRKRFRKFSFLSKYNKIFDFYEWDKFITFYKKKKEEDASHLFSKNLN